MNYAKQVQDMLEHLHNNNTMENKSGVVMALTSAITGTLATIQDHDAMHAAIDGMCDAIHRDACTLHKRRFPEQHTGTMTAEDFLRNVFKPEKFNG